MSRKNLLQAVTLDTELATPFKDNEILWSVATTQKGKFTQQFIYRRTEALALKSRLKKHGLILRRLVVAGCEDTPLLDFSNELIRPYSFWRQTNILLLIAIIGIVGALVWKPIAAKNEIYEQLQSEASILTSNAFELRQELTGIESAQEEKAAFLTVLSEQVLLIDVLRELTVLLPDNVWLSNVQYNANRIILTGTVEGSAAELILGISQSRKLVNPRLSGSVSRGQIPGTENFEITASVRPGGI